MGTIGTTSLFGSFWYYHRLMALSPTHPLLATSQTYQIAQGGYFFYVTHDQYWIFYTLLIGGWSLVAFAAILNYRWKVVKNLTSRGWEYPT